MHRRRAGETDQRPDHCMMTLHTLVQFFGWMLMVNLVFFAIGLLKISVFKDLTSAMTERLFGEFGHKMIADIPPIDFNVLSTDDIYILNTVNRKTLSIEVS